MDRPWEQLAWGAQRLPGFAVFPLPLILFLLIGIFYSSVHMVEQGCQLLLHLHVFISRHPERDWLLFVSYSSQILGEDSDWPVWVKCPSLDQWLLPRVRSIAPTGRQPHGAICTLRDLCVQRGQGQGSSSRQIGSQFPEMRLVLSSQKNKGPLCFSLNWKWNYEKIFIWKWEQWILPDKLLAMNF